MVLAHLFQASLAPPRHQEALVPPTVGKVVPAPAKVLWLYLVLGTSGLLWFYPPSLAACGAALGLTALTLCAGHSVGLHRGIIHQAYSCPRWLRGALAYAFVHTGIGGPIGWIQLHYVRDHYQNSGECPRYFRYDHSLTRDYFWNLHLRFVPRDAAVYAFPASDERDPWLRFLERTWPVHVVALGFALWLGFGPGVALVCVPLRVAVSVLGHWFVGFTAHKRGAIRYDLQGSAEIGRNLPLLGILSFGEGFHNNHHANPSSARMGETPLQLDLGWYLLLAFERLGLVHDLQATGRTPVRRFNARRRREAGEGDALPQTSGATCSARRKH
jgi:fatty-acid desaturase